MLGVVLSVFVGVAWFDNPEAPRLSLPVMAAFGFALIVLAWPLLWLIVGYLRYVLTRDTLGSDTRAGAGIGPTVVGACSGPSCRATLDRDGG
jgi:hypothetical protein